LTRDELTGNCPSCHAKLGEARPTRTAEPERPRERIAPWDDDPAVQKTEAVLGWGTVRAALALLVVGILLVMVAGTSVLLIERAQAARPFRAIGVGGSSRASAGVEMLVPLLSVALIVGLVLYVVGPLMCVAVPGYSRARGWAVAHVVMVGLVGCLVLIYLLGQWANTDAALRHFDAQQAQFEKSLRNPGADFGKRPPRFEEVRMPWSETALWSVLLAMVVFGVLAQLFFTLTMLQVARHVRDAGLVVTVLIYLPIALTFQLGAAALWAFQTFPGRLHFRLAEPLPDWIGWFMIFVADLLGLWLIVQVIWTRVNVTRAMLRRS
jgi:hypothetical protein